MGRENEDNLLLTPMEHRFMDLLLERRLTDPDLAEERFLRLESSVLQILAGDESASVRRSVSADLTEQILQSWRHKSGKLHRYDLRTPTGARSFVQNSVDGTTGTRRRGFAVAARCCFAICAAGVVILLWIADQNEAPLRDPDQRAVAQDARQERLRREEALRQARRWVTLLELNSRRAAAANALLKLGPEAVPALVQAVNDPRPVVVRRVCHILGVLGPQAAAAKRSLTSLSNSKDKELAHLARYALARIQPAGITLVADYGNFRLLEIDNTGKVVAMPFVGLKGGPCDAERLPNGNYLICGYKDRKVVELTAGAKVVWSFTKLKRPVKAQRLLSGNTLIADWDRVLEVDRVGKTVWKYDKDGLVAGDAERLASGNTLILDNGKKRIIEVDRRGNIVWQHEHGHDSHDADRLSNGSTLITLSEKGSPGKVIEVTPKGKVVWELKGLGALFDAHRLPNGHTLVAQRKEVAEFDANGTKIWSVKVTCPVGIDRY